MEAWPSVNTVYPSGTCLHSGEEEQLAAERVCRRGAVVRGQLTARPSAHASLSTFTVDGSTEAHLTLLGTDAAAAGTVAADVSSVGAPAVAMTSASLSVAGCCTATSAITGEPEKTRCSDLS